jgi:hypothetical protein
VLPQADVRLELEHRSLNSRALRLFATPAFEAAAAERAAGEGIRAPAGAPAADAAAPGRERLS